METWTIVAVVLVAVLVGAALPVLLEAYRTLREARRVLRSLDAGLEPAIREIAATARHARRFGDALEPHLGDAVEAVTTVAGFARPLREIRGQLSSLAGVLGAVVPALVAALGAYRAAATAGQPGDDDPAASSAVAESDGGLDDGGRGAEVTSSGPPRP